MSSATEGHAVMERELRRLDALLRRQVLRLRAAYELSLDEFRGLYVSDDRIDRILARSTVAGIDGDEPSAVLDEAEAVGNDRVDWPADSPWARLTSRFALSPFEEEVLLLAVAPNLDLRYETLYSYLNDDVSRKWPTRDLALRLFAREGPARAEARHTLAPTATLLASGLLEVVTSGPSVSWLAEALVPAPGLADHLLGHGYDDHRLGGGVTVRPHDGAAGLGDELEEGIRARLARYARVVAGADGRGGLFVFHGPDREMRDSAAAFVAARLGRTMVRVDLGRMAPEELTPRWVRRLRLLQILTDGLLVLDGADVLFDEGVRPTAAGAGLLPLLGEGSMPAVLASRGPLSWSVHLPGVRRVTVPFPVPPLEERTRLWLLHGAGVSRGKATELAERYLLTGAQIQDAVVQANGGGSEGLVEAIRAQSNPELAKLAELVRASHGWGDLVLPDRQTAELKGVAKAIRNRYLVYRDWGFARRVSAGQGVKVLFSGASGTGKTMAASVIADDLGLDLFAIDLASVVSKYIGETESNLDRIFRAAENCNAILFFDEADALFGKRSEIHDAHDRYANIEVSYLLQKVESHEGAVVLATNLKGNIDEAFGRRMHYVIDFPRPNVEQRMALWTGMFPGSAPLGDDVDFDFLAEQFELTGGEIKAAVLDAAFVAAEGEREIGMRHLTRAVARQMKRKGGVPTRTQFKQYFALTG